MMIKKTGVPFLIITLICFLAGGLAAQNRPNEVAPPDDAADKDRGNACYECHKDLQGKLQAPAMEWEKSIHGKSGKNCNICHGGNPSINDAKKSKAREFRFTGKPDRKMIPMFCGKGECHGTALLQFKKGPHFGSVQKKGEPNCVSCHGSHGIQRSSAGILTDKACAACHPAEYSRKLVGEIFKTEKEIEAINADIIYIQGKGVEVKDMEARLANIRHLFHQMVHIFSVEDMKYTGKIMDLEIKSAKAELFSKVSVTRRLDLLYVLTLSICLIIVLGFGIYTVIRLVRTKKRQ